MNERLLLTRLDFTLKCRLVRYASRSPVSSFDEQGGLAVNLCSNSRPPPKGLRVFLLLKIRCAQVSV
jgi:hypothetical protein